MTDTIQLSYKNLKHLITCLMMLVFFCWSNGVFAQGCNYKVGSNVILGLVGQSSGTNYTSKLVLTNSSGIIQYVSAANIMNIPNVAAGNYNAIAVTYDNQTVPNLNIGTDLNIVNSCNKSTSLPIGVCDCNNTTGNLLVSQTGQTNITGQTNQFVLTDDKGVILSVSNTPTFNGKIDGIYNIYAVSYTGTSPISVGQSVNNIVASCVSISNPIGYVVCLPLKPIANPDNTTATAGVPKNIPVLTNDKNPDGTAVTDLTKITIPVVTTTPSKGIAIVKADGTIDYTPNAGTSGTDTFIYTICNKANTTVCSTAVVTVTISPIIPNPSVPSLGCNYKSGDVSVTLSGQSSGANITSKVVLLDANNTIKYISNANSTTLSSVLAGNYSAVGITYDNAQIPNLVIGGTLANVTSCYKTTPLSTLVCDCNTLVSVISATPTGQSSKSGQINKFVLTNGNGIILQIGDASNYTGLTDGVYNMYAVSYDGGQTINNLSIGSNIQSVSSSCLSISEPVSYIVCLPVNCKADVCIPFTVKKTKIGLLP